MAGTSTAITMSPGMSIDISVPVDQEVGQGEFKRPVEDEVKIGGVVKPHILGFVSEFPAVGTITEVAGPELKITYSHLQNKPNRVFFFTNDNDQHTISIISMPIHDHSSMYQGGPAYGTYAYDKIVEEETTEPGV
jgi:hypothetical protein